MPGESVLSGKGWKDLPSALQTRILSFLFEYPEERHSRPFKLSLEYAKNLATILPSDLLNVAEASPDLCDHVREVLGSRAQYLTANVAGDLLDMWVSVLGPQVKAVSAWDAHFDFWTERIIPEDGIPDALIIRRRQAVRLFRVLQENVNLHVLDLKDVPFDDCDDIEEHLLSSLVGALQQSSESLKELALPLAELCNKALERVSFNNLLIVELEFRRWESREEITDAEDERTFETCMQMLQSLNGHPAGSQNATTIRELRLLNVHTSYLACIHMLRSLNGLAAGSQNVTTLPSNLHTRYADSTQSNFPKDLFNAVTTLRLECLRSRCPGFHTHVSDVLFISLFPNLECLRWNGDATEDRLEEIIGSCSNTQELHLRPCTLYGDWNFHSLEALLLTSQEKMRTFEEEGFLTVANLKRIGELCPGLKHLRLCIHRENVGALALLLGSQCRYIRKLKLHVLGEEEDQLRAAEWATLIDGVRCASDELSEVELVAADDFTDEERDIALIVPSMIDLIAVLGERARDVRLKIYMKEPNLRPLIDASCDILKACLTHTNCCLERLDIWFFVDSILIRESLEEEKAMVRRFLRERRNLIEAAPRLHTICFQPFEIPGCIRRHELLTDCVIRI